MNLSEKINVAIDDTRFPKNPMQAKFSDPEKSIVSGTIYKVRAKNKDDTITASVYDNLKDGRWLASYIYSSPEEFNYAWSQM